MPKPWFRLYRSMVDNAKAQALRPDLFKAWINILCCTDDEGNVPPIDVLCFKLRRTQPVVAKYISELSTLGFIVDNRAHDWSEHQYKSDVSTDRVKRFRERSTQRFSNADGNVPDTDTDSEEEKKRKVQKKKSAAQSRSATAQRWPSDAVVPDEWIADGLDARARNALPALDLRPEAEAFANYWASKSGKDATKLDWKRTWLNWCLNAKGKPHGTAKPTQLEQLAGIIRDDRGFDD
ncbi:MAG: hypothetical protein E6Q97_32605 [Desulfurellales bacterium]|nr:MAG: hypothetical protein E6Q97_32605 [Desulfurellales bacterium]